MANTQLYSTASVPSSINEATVAEDVSNIVTNLFPKDKPLQMWLGREAMSQPMKEYPIRRTSNITRNSTMFTAADPAGVFVKPEFNTASLGAAYYHAKLKGIAEIHQEAFGVSATMQTTDIHGTGDPYADRLADTMDKVGNDFEMACWWSPGTTVFGAELDSGSGVHIARQTQGLMHWVLASGLERTKVGTGGSSLTDGNGNVFSSTLTAALNKNMMTYALDLNGVNLDRGSFRTLMEQWYGMSGNLQDGCVIFCSGGVKGLFTQFANTAQGPINERKVEAAGKIVYDTIDAYETDYGMHFVNISRYLTPTPDFTSSRSTTFTHTSGTTTVAWEECLIAIDPKYYKIGVLRPVQYNPLPRDADGEKGQITLEQGLLCQNPQAGVGIVNCLAT